MTHDPDSRSIPNAALQATRTRMRAVDRVARFEGAA